MGLKFSTLTVAVAFLFVLNAFRAAVRVVLVRAIRTATVVFKSTCRPRIAALSRFRIAEIRCAALAVVAIISVVAATVYFAVFDCFISFAESIATAPARGAVQALRALFYRVTNSVTRTLEAGFTCPAPLSAEAIFGTGETVLAVGRSGTDCIAARTIRIICTFRTTAAVIKSTFGPRIAAPHSWIALIRCAPLAVVTKVVVGHVIACVRILVTGDNGTADTIVAFRRRSCLAGPTRTGLGPVAVKPVVAVSVGYACQSDQVRSRASKQVGFKGNPPVQSRG